MAQDDPVQNHPDQAGDLPQNVIVMPRPTGDGRFPHIAMVEAYWLALRGRRIVPRRTDIDPRGIEASLEQAFIAEMIAPGVARLRIAGMHLTRLMGMEVRGMPLSALFVPQARDELEALLHDMTHRPQMMTLCLQAEGRAGSPPLEARMLLLPMRGDTDAIDRVLGCLSSDGAVGLSPRRFAIMSRRVTPLTPPPQDAWQHHLRETRPSLAMPQSVNPASAQGLNDAAAAFQRGPHLRVVSPTSQDKAP